MPISRIALTNFTAFADLEMAPSTGLNVLVGANGTGKTHLMKVAYGACDVSRTGQPLLGKLVALFLPADRRLGRLVTRRQGVESCRIHIENGKHSLSAEFTSRQSDRTWSWGAGDWRGASLQSAYIPVKEMLANAPGFLSLYEQREVHFEETYRDILLRAFVPPPPPGAAGFPRTVNGC